MPHKAKILGAERIAAVEKYLRGEDSLNHLATLLDVCPFISNNGFKPINH